MQKIISEVLNTQMSRQQFLKHIGALLLTVIGFTALTHAVKSSQLGAGASQNLSVGKSPTPYGG